MIPAILNAQKLAKKLSKRYSIVTAEQWTKEVHKAIEYLRKRINTEKTPLP